MRTLIPGEVTGGRFAIIELRARRGNGPLRHIHEGEDEFVCILAGRVVFEVGDVTHDAPAETCLLLPRGIAHTYRVESHAARLLVVAIPAGIEGYYHELAQLATRSGGAADIERLVAIAAHYGIAITGPGLQARRSLRSPPATLCGDSAIGSGGLG